MADERDPVYDFRVDKERMPDMPLFPADAAARQMGSKFDFNDYNPLVRGYMVMPKSMICKGCGKQASFSPFSVITYMNRKMVLEGHCDQCIYLKINEGKIKLAEWQEKNTEIENKKKQSMFKRMFLRDEEQKKKANIKKRDPLRQDKGTSV